MYFKKLEMHGFKSFAEPTTVEFDRGITCVVGPNGSGKSNICDAIRWVLGEQSSKTLRGDKMEDVIFAGTASRKSRGMAEVTLTIDNSDGDLDIDYNEVAITRRMYRSGESEYLINNNQCRMKDIRELIMDTGIGVEGYSLIGQGKISDIISNKTESIREILEETAGIVSYRSKKAEAERKLDSSAANMERVNDIVSEIESRIGGLKEDSEKAKEFIELRDRHKELEINITLKNIDNIEEKNKSIKNDIDELEGQITSAKTRRGDISTRIASDSTRRTELDELAEKARERQSTVTEAINELVNRGQVRTERMSAITRDSERLREEILGLEENIRREKEGSRELFESKSGLDEKMQKLQAELSEKNERFASGSQSLTEKGREIDDRKSRMFDIQNTISSKKAELNSMNNLSETLDRRREAVLAEKNKGDETSSGSRESLEEAKKSRDGIKSELEAARSEKERIRQEHGLCRQQETEMSRKLEDLKIRIGQIYSRKNTIEEMEANYEGYNAAVKHIMKEDRRGIDGVIADLIRVPSGFETAMETAFGGKLQNIVCGTADDAKAAIEELKSKKAGRATFLPLDSIRPREAKKATFLSTMTGFKGYGADCIQFDEKYRPAIENLIGNVIVVDSMDNAVSMAARADKGWKYVTLEGEIINVGGSITGGRYRNETANILERKAEISSLDSELNEAGKEKENDEKKLKELREKIEDALTAVAEKDRQINGLEKEMFSRENEIAMAEASLSDYASNNERWERELSSIADEQKNAGEATSKLSHEIEELNSGVSEIERRLAEETEVYNEQKDKLDAVSHEITEARIAAGSCESEKSKVDALAARVSEAIERFSAGVADRSAEMERLEKEKNSITANIDDSESELEARKTAKSEIDGMLAGYNEEKEKLLTRLDESGTAREELDETITALQNQKYELEIREARQDTQLENAKSKLWDEFEVSYVQALDMRNSEFVMSSAVRENREIKKRIKELGEVNVGAISEYEAVSERYEFLISQRQDIEKSRDELKKIISDMDRIIRSRFKESFDQVVENFESVFRDFYGGGHARISLADENDPFGSEIEIIAQPPGKQLKHINLLSGGEKTMTAIALMFAVLKTKPTPYCILDEIEAALDDRNLEIFGKYLKNFEGVQFTLITHQKETMEHADVMYGITMPESGVSKVYSLQMGEEPAV